VGGDENEFNVKIPDPSRTKKKKGKGAGANVGKKKGFEVESLLDQK